MANRVVTKQKKANSVDPDETAHKSRLIWIYTVCKNKTLVCRVEKEFITKTCLFKYTVNFTTKN